jgi:hypothetical protein
VTLVLVPVIYATFVLDLKLVTWNPDGTPQPSVLSTDVLIGTAGV